MNYFSISALINTISFLSLGLFVFLKNKKNPINYLYFIFSLSVSFWNFSYFFWQISETATPALFWCRMITFGAITIPVTHAHHFLMWLKRFKENRTLIYIGYLLTTFFFIANFTPLMVKGVSQKLFFKFWPDPGPLYIFFVMFLILYALYMTYILSKGYFISTGLRKLQLKYILPATLIAYSGGCTNFFLWYNIPIPPYGHILVSIYAFSMTYAIFKTHVLDITFLIRKGLVYSAVAGLFTGIYLIAIFFLSQAFQIFTGQSSVIVAILLLLAFALAFQPIKTRVQDYIDRIFFKGKYEYQKTLKNLSNAISSIINLEELLGQITNTVRNIMKIDKASVFLFDNDKDCFVKK